MQFVRDGDTQVLQGIEHVGENFLFIIDIAINYELMLYPAI